MSVWNGFHDATVVTIELQWETGELTIRVRTADGPYTIVATGVRNFICPRAHPWGPSKSIMEIDEPVDGVLTIRMQSGDDLVIEAANFSVSP